VPAHGAVRRVVHRRVTGHDFNLFHAIVGTQPIMAPRAAEQAVISAMAALPPAPADATALKKLKLPSIPRPAWSAAAFAAQVRDFCERELRGRVNRPNMAHWMRHVSDEAIKRIEEAQARLASRRIAPAARKDPSRRAA
jgi:hypothetical protein